MAIESKKLPVLHAVIGVWRKGQRTYYVRRSEKMANYPGVWSLFSIQFDPIELPAPEDLKKVQDLMKKMAEERLCGASIETKGHLLSDDSDHNPIDTHVFLNFYEIHFPRDPKLNPNYYTDGAWLTFDEYRQRLKSSPGQCGSCIRMWWDYAWGKGWCDHPFPGEAE